MPINRLPNHLKKYVIEQNQTRYSNEDQAVWRFILRQLKSFLSEHAHPFYLEGLKKTGIEIEQIPSIKDISNKLENFGWSAAPVSGFLPPAAFMELQSLNILPIASDMRRLKNINYTPAPDIVHEAAGHAPMLAHPEYAEYLRKYALVCKKSIISKQDLKLYEAIRILSDLKESKSTTQLEIKTAEQNLLKRKNEITFTSEAALLGRMNWWTAEYGLFGSINNPKILGAGLLSSIGEAKACLSDKVKKIPLSLECINYSYDITEMQPQLFVTESFQHMTDVLEEFSNSLAFKSSGVECLKKILPAKSVNTIVLNSQTQISGILESYITNKENEIEFIKFSGPCQLSHKNIEILGHGTDRHPHGFSSPLGPLEGTNKCLSDMTEDELKSLGFINGKSVHLKFKSKIELKGTLDSILYLNKKPIICTFKNCTVKRGQEIFFDPSWGDFDMVLGSKISNGFGGAADLSQFDYKDDFKKIMVTEKQLSEKAAKKDQIYKSIRHFRENKISDENQLLELLNKTKDTSKNWLLLIELYEIAFKNNFLATLKEIELILNIKAEKSSEHLPTNSSNIFSGIELCKNISI